MARTKGKGSKATFHRYSSPSLSPPPQRSPSPPSPPSKPNSPSSSLSAPLLTPPSSFMNGSPEASPKSAHASSPEHSSVLKDSSETLVETNPLAMIIHPLFPILSWKNEPTKEDFQKTQSGDDNTESAEVVFEENQVGQGESKFTEAVNEETQEHSVEGRDIAMEKPQEVSAEKQSKPKKQKVSKSDPSLSKSKVRVKTKKSQSCQNRRRSTRLMFGFGTKKKPVIDTTVYDISDSDSSENSDSEDSTFIPEESPKSDPEIVPQKVPIKSPPKKEVPKKAPTKQEKGKGKAESSKIPVEKENSPPKKNRNTSGNLSLSKHIPLMDPVHYKIFKEKWSSRPIVPGRYYDFEALKTDKIVLQKYTDAMGWTKFLQIREKHYPKLVRAFFCRAKVYPDKALIVSKIKDIEISLTPEELGTILSLPTDGNCLFGDNWNEKLGIDIEFINNNVFEPNSSEINSANLQKIPKMLNIITQYNILPRKGSFDIVTKNDLMVLYHILFGERLNLPFVLIQHMIATAQNTNRQSCVPYGMMLTKVFQKFLVPLHDEESLLIIKKFCPKNVKHMKDSEDVSKKRKRNDDDTEKPKPEKSKLPDHPSDQSPVLEEHGVLLSNFQTQASSMIKATDVLQSFTSNAVKATKVSKFSHLFISPPKTDFSALFKSDDVSKFFHPPAFESSVPMSSLHSVQSACPSNFSNKPSSDPKSGSKEERPPKKSRLEKSSDKTRDAMRKLFENQVYIMNHLSYYTHHNQVHQTWQTSALSISLNLPPPTDLPVQPPIYNLHVPDISSSSDASSPTAPSGTPPRE